jgi:hypothetical protein
MIYVWPYWLAAFWGAGITGWMIGNGEAFWAALNSVLVVVNAMSGIYWRKERDRLKAEWAMRCAKWDRKWAELLEADNV